MDFDAVQFRQPPAEYRPVAMWFLNGRLDRQEVRRQIGAMAAGGIGGIQVVARTGLETPYLSEAWFRLLELIFDTAHRHGLLLQHPEYRAWRMRASRLIASPGQDVQAVAPGSVLLHACAVPLNGGVADWTGALPLDAYVGLLQHQLEVVPVFGALPRIGLRLPASAWYATSFEARYVPREARLGIEDAALSGTWDIWLNGLPVPCDAFAARRRWSSDNREADVTAWLEQGSNELLLRVDAARSRDGLVDAIYLLGDFAVLHDGIAGAVLAQPPVHIRWAERHTAGYPNFAGTLQLSKSVPLDVAPGAFRVRLPDAELMIAGSVSSSTSALVTVSVTNTLVELLEAKRYDPRHHQVVRAPRGHSKEDEEWPSD